jgi:hypothetical protein
MIARVQDWSMASWLDHLPSGNQKRFIAPNGSGRICRRLTRSARFRAVGGTFVAVSNFKGRTA